MDAGTKHETTDDNGTKLTASTLDDQNLARQPPTPNTDWLSDPPRTAPTPQRNLRVDVSIDTKTLPS